MLRDKFFEHPKLVISISVLLMLFGVVMPFLMVIGLVESTFFLNFLSYACSVLGFVLGLTSLAASRLKREHQDRDDLYP